MARYDWPAPPESTDDPNRRIDFQATYRPSADVRLEDGTLQPLPKVTTRRRSRRVAKAPPVGGRDLWLPIGPSEVMRGQARGRPDVSGRVRDIAVDTRANGQRVYAATAGGGVWMSDDSGITWRPLNEFVVSPNRHTVTPVGSALSCGALYVIFGAALDGADDEVWVGTGEPSRLVPGGNPGGNLLGVGVLHAVGPSPVRPWVVEPGSDVLRGKYVWRIVPSPVDPQHLFAATSAGVFHRPPGRPWTLLGTLGSARSDESVDVLVTRRSATELRVWVPTFSGLHVGSLTLPLPAAPAALPTVNFASVSLDALGSTHKQLALGAADQLWVLGRRNTTGNETFPPAQLWRIDPSVGSPSATRITGVPPALFGEKGKDQSTYDMCIAVHPDTPNRVFVGGSGLVVNNLWQAGVYSLTVTGNAAVSQWIGANVHADVHAIRVGPKPSAALPDRVVWVGCDGGAFRSVSDAVPGSFVARNAELATLEPGYVACHPTNEGLVAVGMQDNGTCERRGDTVWELTHMGDGGGIVYDPGSDHRFFRQYLQAHWETSDGSGIHVVHRHSPSTDSEDKESQASVFYSGASALAHGGTTHLLIGTDRPWYSADWGRHWKTIPTANDPRDGANPDRNQDRIDSVLASRDGLSFECCNGRRYAGIITTRLSPANAGAVERVRAHVLWGGGLSMFLGTKPATAGDPWTWAHEELAVVRVADTTPEKAIVEQGIPTRFLPAAGLVTDVAVHDPQRGTHGSCYVTTVGAADPTIDTVWWYDGTNDWYSCGVRNRQPVGRGTWTVDPLVAPAMAVVVDPTDPNVVFVGTSIGVIRGELVMVDHGAGLVPEWAWKPFDNGLPETAVNDLAIFSDGTLRLLRAALHGRGVWEVDLADVTAEQRTFVRVYHSDMRRRRPTPLSGPATAGQDNVRFDASPDIIVDSLPPAFPARGPTESELYHLTQLNPPEPDIVDLLDHKTFQVHVLVHHRWPFEATPAQVKVALLRRDLGPAETNPPLGTIWSVLVNVAGGAAAPNPLPGGWFKAGSQLARPIVAATDARRPRVATFDVDLTTHPPGRMMFVAVVMSADDQITANELLKPDGFACTTLRELVVHSRHVGARSAELLV